MNLKKVKIRSRHPSHDALRGQITVKQCDLPFKNKLNPKGRPSVVVRFGSPTEVRRGNVEVNSTEAISVSSNKMKMKEAFEDFGILSPKYFTLKDIKYLKSNKEEIKFPLILKRVVGSRGRGMQYLGDNKALKKALKKIKEDKKKNGKKSIKDIYFEEYFSGKYEYRLHVSSLGCFYACRKALKKDTPDDKRYFRNDSNCIWYLESNTTEFKKPSTWGKIVEECIKAKDAVGLDFAAIDVRVSEKGVFKIIETNSAPSLATEGIKKYKTHLPLLIKDIYDRANIS